MHMVPETMAEMAWWALGINLATFVMACVHRILTLTLSEAITDTPVSATLPIMSTHMARCTEARLYGN